MRLMPATRNVRPNSAGAASIPETSVPSATPRPPPAPDSGASNAFICSFCWQLVFTRPRVVGQSARLTCEPYYSSLVDLAVGWACGEVVVRGDDCVSLGWCFWHRVCYGCLFYGNKRVVRGTTLDELYQDGEDEGVARTLAEPGRGKGEEINEIPLCANCLVENEADSLDDDALAQRALRRIAHPDGGLSKARWEERLKLRKADKSIKEAREGSEVRNFHNFGLMGLLT